MMEDLISESAETQPTVPLSPSVHISPTLRDPEDYHVFISYSSTDYRWTHSLIQQLESCSLRICYHERDFVPGRTVLENMSECIQKSQKVLLVLSPEFVRSRWCLLEANMSLFRDCLERKPVVPVLLEPEVAIPLHLCHLTYLEAKDPDFENKLLKVLCTPNQQLQGSTVVPFHPPSIYNGKALQPLTAFNKEHLERWEAGQFSDMEVPDQLRLVIEDHNKYREAVRIINSVYENQVYKGWVRSLLFYMTIFVTIALGNSTFAFIFLAHNILERLGELQLFMYVSVVITLLPLGLCSQLFLWKTDEVIYVQRKMRKAVGEANLILSEEKVLMGCCSNSQLYLVYVSLDGCKHQFAETFSEQDVAEEMFQRALRYFSPGYTCCLAKRHFPFGQPSSPGHLEEGVCFCQYVTQQLSAETWE